MRIRVWALLILAGVAFGLAACGGGSSGGVTPSAQSSPGIQQSETQVTAVTASGGTLTYGKIAGITSATVGFSSLTAAGSVTGVLSASVPTGVPTPSAIRRPETLGAATTPLAYCTITFAQSEGAGATPAFSVTLPSAPAAGNGYLVVYSSTIPNGWQVVSGPTTISGATISFSASALTPPLVLAANTPYVFAIVDTTSTLATATPGITYNFTGTMTQSNTYTYPSSSPFPDTSTSATVTETVSSGSSPAPNATPATDIHAVTVANGTLSGSTTTTDTWIASTGTTLVEYATASSDNVTPTADTLETLYATPEQIDVVPEAASTWTNGPGKTVSEGDSDGTTDTRVVASDGTYSDTQTVPYGLTLLSNDATDGSGTMLGTLFPAIDGVGGFEFTAPSGGVIDVNLLDTSTPPNVIVALGTPAPWFSPSPALSSETDAETVGATFPAGCKVPSVEGTSGNDIAQTISTIDPIFGYTEVQTTNTYTSASWGPVCIQIGDVQTYYYDYLNDTYAAWYDFADFAGTVQSTVTTNETLTLQSAAGTTVTVFDATRKSAGTSVRAAMLPAIAARSQFNALIVKQRATRLKTFEANMKRAAAQHGGSPIK